jgi:hypothetical protein
VRDVHLDPDELRAVAASAEALLPVLRLPVPDAAEVAVLGAEHDRLTSAAARAVRELAELAAGLRAVAAAAEAADTAAVRALRGWG